MTKPVNLRQYRKVRARADKARAAEVNRVVHGTPKAVRDLEAARQEQAARRIEAHRRTGEGEAGGQSADPQATDGVGE
ncbi:DUF4169 family protein [Hyphomonadaceae bacterium ML37]|nr:DUF4169 family protein [Hyphomonadaceae bacterium ML37]